MRPTTRPATLAAVAASWLLGCTGPLVNVSPVPPTAYSEAGKARGDACGLLLFPMIPIAVNDRVERAYVGALESQDASFLVDTAITESWYFALVGTVVCTRVEGLALRKVDGPRPEPLESR